MKRALLLALLAAAACQPRTEMMIGIATDIRAPDILDAVQLTVTRVRDGFPEQQLPPWTISGLRNIPFNLPGSYGVYSPDGSETKLIVDLVGLKNDVPQVTRTAVLSLVSGKTLFLRMGLVVGCMGRKDCKATESCVEGRCVDQEINAHTLPDFKDELVTSLSCNSGTNFINTQDGTPMPMLPDATSCPGSLCGEGTCFKPAEADSPSNAFDGGVKGPDGSTGLSMCPDDQVGGLGVKLADVGDATGLAVDGNDVFFTDAAQNGIFRMGPCGGAGPLFMNETGAHGLAVAGGKIFWIANNNIRMAPTSGGQPVTVASISATNRGTLVSDGQVIYFTDSTTVFRVNAMQGASVMTEQSTVTPGGSGANFLALDAGNLAWINGMNVALKKTGAGTFSTFPIINATGLAMDPTGLYFMDSSSGLNFVPNGGSVMSLAPTDMFMGVPGRIATDGQHVFAHSATGSADALYEITNGDSYTTLANQVSFAAPTVQPALAVAVHGVYWINAQSQIFRAPVVP